MDVDVPRQESGMSKTHFHSNLKMTICSIFLFRCFKAMIFFIPCMLFSKYYAERQTI